VRPFQARPKLVLHIPSDPVLRVHFAPLSTAESYLSGELDLCPKCFKANEQKHAGAEKQRFGQPVPEPKPKGKRPASGKAGGKKKK